MFSVKTSIFVSKIKFLFHKLEINSAVFFGLLAKFWGLFAGIITALLIVARFNPELQGYYYTFGSLLAFQVFAELGFGTVIIQFASHEWSKLRFDKNGYIVGDEVALSRLTSLAQIAFKWYLVAGLFLILVLGLGGYFFFLGKSDPSIPWKAPWLILSFLTGISIFLIPIWSLLEGCNQVSRVYGYRFIQSLFRHISIWVAIFLGAKLWAIAISSIIVFIAAVVFFILKYKNFLKTLLFFKPIGSRIDWRLEILPMQWRMALSWSSGYFMAAFFTPVLFRYHGPVLAGQMGLTLSLVSVVAYISSSWVLPRVPAFGILINRGEFSQLDKMFWKITKAVLLISILVSIAILSVVYLIDFLGIPLSSRILSPLPIALLLAATVVNGMCLPMGYYLIAHKKMPTFKVSIMAGILTCISTLIFGKYYAVNGIAFGYLFVMVIALVWTVVIWQRCRIAWHVKSEPLTKDQDHINNSVLVDGQN